MVSSKHFTKNNITCVEYIEETYNDAVSDAKFGGCMVKGEFVDTLRTRNFRKLSLIYADFTASVKNGAGPLLNQLKIHEDEISKGTVVGLTWSNRNGGNKDKNLVAIDRFFMRNNYDAIDSMQIYSYGSKKNMNVCFYRKL